MLREPAVAGQFYSNDPAELRQTLSAFCPGKVTKSVVTGLMVPHAGYIYSGAIAGQVYDRAVMPDRVILLGPNHHGTGHAGAVYTSGRWRTPLGLIEIDASLAAALLAATPCLKSDTTAHRFEHSLEVQVPFIQYLNPNASLVPICLGYQPLEALLEIAEAIARVVRATPEPILLIASTDMTHFESAENAAKKDHLALEYVKALDAEGLFRTVVEQRISMCGFIPTVVLLKVSELLGATQSEIILYGNSGDVTRDFSNVVAYAGALVGTA